MTTIQRYPFAASVVREESIRVTADDQSIEVLATDAEPVATFGCDGPVKVRIETRILAAAVHVSPLHLGISPKVEGEVIELILPGPRNIAIMVGDHPVLYIFANPLERNVPRADDPNVIFIPAGEVRDLGELHLASGQTLYVEGGGVFQGRIRADGGDNITIDGYGILDGYSETLGPDRSRQLMMYGVNGVMVKNVLMIRPKLWMLVVDTCKDVIIDSVKQIGEVSSSDGVDIVSSQNVKVTNCFMRNGDDCVVIKSLNLSDDPHREIFQNVENVDITGCTMLSYRGGSATEIGYELRCDLVSDVRFRDCDVIGVHNFGSVFGIHNSDHATVRDITWSDIRVEHHYDKLVDLRIVKSRWGRDEHRGQIRNITLKNIDVNLQPYNAGYSCSIIGGFDAEHTVEGIQFEGFRMAGEAILDSDALFLFTKRASGITFRE